MGTQLTWFFWEKDPINYPCWMGMGQVGTITNHQGVYVSPWFMILETSKCGWHWGCYPLFFFLSQNQTTAQQTHSSFPKWNSHFSLVTNSTPLFSTRISAPFPLQVLSLSLHISLLYTVAFGFYSFRLRNCSKSTGKRSFKRNSSVLFCQCSFSSSDDSAKPATLSLQREGRRALMGCVLVAGYS